ncbi:MAG: NYN domain-containing protein [Alphaproteobacteria bacterium]|nr:NYN domain-containing protein [Alphaproteobacteria bacterium]
MKRSSEGSLLSTVFVDYDNIYLSLKRKNEEAAKRFAKDAGLWLAEIASGRIITPTNSPVLETPRRIVMNRCYGNPVPRRNTHDNSTDMNSFPFVRHHYLRAGFEVIDCPPLTAQLKNSADIRMVMDVRDYLLHDTYFDEFIILSGDADFTPVLHRLRQHARRTVIYSNDHTATPYTAISDGEVREADLIAVLMGGRAPQVVTDEQPIRKGLPNPQNMVDARKAIIADVLGHVRADSQPLLLEVLADRAVRTLGHERTVGTAWGGAGSFRDLLVNELPDGVEVTEHAPHYVLDTARQPARAELRSEPRPHQPAREAVDRFASTFGEIRPEPLVPNREAAPLPQQAAPAPAQAQRDTGYEQRGSAPAPHHEAAAPTQHGHYGVRSGEQSLQPRLAQPRQPDQAYAPQARAGQPHQQQISYQEPGPSRQAAPAAERPQQPGVPREPASPPARAAQIAAPQASAAQVPATRPADGNASAIQKSIARIHEACQAPPISPPEYRVLFDVMAEEINANGLTGTQTLVNISERAKDLGVEIRKDDARFILEVVSEADPWFEQGASASLFASRFRNFVIARCKSQNLQLSATELDLIEAWFTGVAPRVAAQKDPAHATGRQSVPQNAVPQNPAAAGYARAPAPQHGQAPGPVQQAPADAGRQQDWFAGETQAHPQSATVGDDGSDFGRYSNSTDDFPRVLRNRTRA